MPELTGKVVLVTGASRGIGAATAVALGEAGATVVLAARDGDRAREVASGIASADAAECDVSDYAAVDRVVQDVQRRFGRINALVNNAGVNHDDLAPSLSDEDWSIVLDTNLTAAFRLTRRALRGMLRARAGRIVNISSVAGLRANPGQANQIEVQVGYTTIQLNGSQLPTITGQLTIDNFTSAPTAISGQGKSRVLEVASGSSLTVNGLVIEDGSTTGGGGGILAAGVLTLHHVTVEGCTAVDGGGIDSHSALSIDQNSTVENNSASDFGGGIRKSA